MGIAVPNETESQYNGRIEGYMNDARKRNDVVWVNAGDLVNKDNNFFGHSKVNKQNIVKNPPKQVPQLGKDRFYSDVKNNTGKL